MVVACAQSSFTNGHGVNREVKVQPSGTHRDCGGRLFLLLVGPAVAGVSVVQGFTPIERVAGFVEVDLVAHDGMNFSFLQIGGKVLDTGERDAFDSVEEIDAGSAGIVEILKLNGRAIRMNNSARTQIEATGTWVVLVDTEPETTVHDLLGV